ncbi:MAG: winged helix-turn-helix domain-containing protein [Candidatus Eremiobacteraeota bacterium]|nr:winged helix-turn-helix domain-containing protein [Candidatus Eremiobacteraeota bacterium]
MEQSSHDLARYSFGPYVLSAAERVLRFRGQPVVLAPKALDVLFELASHIDVVVSKQDLIERVWPQNYVDEANLSQNVYVLRRLFERHRSEVTIENIPKRGYRLRVPGAAVAQPPHLARVNVRAFTQRRLRIGGGAVAAGILIAIAAVFPLVQHTRTDRELHGDALAKYMLGRTYEAEGSPRNLLGAARLFRAVLQESPGTAQGYAGLAESYASLAYYADDEAQRAALQAGAIDLAREAVSKDSTSADAYASRGGVEFSIAHREQPARSDFQRALALDPNQPEALVWYGTLLMNRGEVGPARRMFGRALGIEPNSPGTAASLAWSDFIAGDYAEAIILSKQMLLVHQLPSIARITLANAYIALHDYADARIAAVPLSRDPNTRYQAIALAAQIDASTGHAALAASDLQRLDATVDTRASGGWDATSIAAAYLAVRDRPHAFAWLQRVAIFERRLLARDPRFATLANDRDFLNWAKG